MNLLNLYVATKNADISNIKFNYIMCANFTNDHSNKPKLLSVIIIFSLQLPLIIIKP